MAEESKLQSKIKKDLESKGWLVNKIMLCSLPGWPDLECIRLGKNIKLEIKAKGKKLTPLQEHIHKKIISNGGDVYTVDSYEAYLKIML